VTQAVEPIQIADWRHYPWLRHGFSTRGGGVSSTYGPTDLNLGFTADDSAFSVKENRRLFTAAVGRSSAFSLVAVRQVHGARAIAIRGDVSETPGSPLEADGLLTALPAVLLAMQTADCVPVLIADTKNRVVAAFHAGWRGTVARIVEHGVVTMQTEYNSHPDDLIAAIGPSIGQCCYAVGEQLRQEFGTAFAYAPELFHSSAEELKLDLWEANRRQLLSAGLAPERIVTVGQCTACTFEADGQRRFFSHRAEAGFTGRMMSVIGVASQPTNLHA
jgi:YfiH family protein